MEGNGVDPRGEAEHSSGVGNLGNADHLTTWLCLINIV